MAGLLFVIVVGVFVYSASGDCPDGFLRHDLSCYKIPRIKASWADATEYCKNLNAELAGIETEKENRAITGILSNIWSAFSPSKFWVSGNDMLEEGKWVWAGNGARINDGFTDWSDGQPDSGSHGEESCLELSHEYHWKWNDQECDEEQFFVCEKSSLSLEPPSVIG